MKCPLLGVVFLTALTAEEEKGCVAVGDNENNYTFGYHHCQLYAWGNNIVVVCVCYSGHICI